MLLTVLPSMAATSYGIPASIRALLSLRQARVAVQARDQDAAIAAIKRGRAAAQKPAGETIEAAFMALLAIAQRQSNEADPRAQENFDAASSAFENLLRSEQALVAPFLQDYQTMLGQFGAFEKTMQMAQKLNELIRGGSAPWVPLAVTRPGAAMILELGILLRDTNDKTAAFEIFMHAAGLALASGEHTLALTAVNHALDTQPANADAHRMRGVIKWEAGDPQGARQEFEAAVNAMPADPDAALSLAHAWLALGNLQAALDAAATLSAVHTDCADALILVGEAHRLLGEAARVKGDEASANAHWLSAIESLTKALPGSCDQKSRFESRAITFYRLKDFPSALADVECSLACDPSDVDGNGWSAEVLLSLNRNTEALERVDVALALLSESSGQTASRRPWLLGIKGRALMRTAWHQQAVEALEEAISLQPSDRDLAMNLLIAFKGQGDWVKVAQCAEKLQRQPFEESFLLTLRIEEVNAHRNRNDYACAFKVLARAPLPPPQHPRILWVTTRLLADVGDFEKADDLLTRVVPGVDTDVRTLSLHGWVAQNLEARDEAQRTMLAAKGIRFYEAALDAVKHRIAASEQINSEAREGNADKAARQNRTDLVWLLKGLANAKLRSGAGEEAFSLYREVIEQCEQQSSSLEESPRVLVLTGWCYHCLGEHKLAARYYESSLDKAESKAGVSFDHAVVLASVPSDQWVEIYKHAAESARGQGSLRCIGLCRVALHDLRELLFRGLVPPDAGRMANLLCIELLDATASLESGDQDFAERIYAFLETAVTHPVAMAPLALQAVRLRIEGARASQRGDTAIACQLQEEVAHLYSQNGDSELAASAWRNLSLRYQESGNLDRAYDTARNALQENLYLYHPEHASQLIALVTRCVDFNLRPQQEYEDLLQEVYRMIGPERAYLDAHTLVEEMPPGERDLFVRTILKLFPPVYWDERWLYLRGDEILRVPNSHAIVSPINSYMRLNSFREAQEAVLEAAA